MEVPLVNIIQNAADLKTLIPQGNMIVFVLSKSTPYDNLGGFYRWDNTSTISEDMVYMNTIISSTTPTGRWIRVFQKVSVLPHGILINNGGVRTFYSSGTTNSSGDITLNLTLENTPTGTPIFKDVWFNDSKSTLASTGPSNSVTSYVKSLSSDLKQTTHGFFKANALTITLNLLYAPLASVGAGVPVQFKIEGT